MRARKSVRKAFIFGVLLGGLLASMVLCASHIITRHYSDAALTGGWYISKEYASQENNWQIKSFDFHSASPFEAKTVDIELRNGDKLTLTYDLVSPLKLGSRTIVIHDFPGVGDITCTHTEQPFMYFWGDNPIVNGEYFYAG